MKSKSQIMNVKEFKSAEQLKMLPTLPDAYGPPMQGSGPTFASLHAKNVRDMMKKTEQEMKNIIQMKFANLYDQVTLLVDQIQKIEQQAMAVGDMKDRKANMNALQQMDVNTNDIIDLNIGGRHFQVGRDLLLNAGNGMSKLAQFFGQTNSLKKDKEGRIFLDRDPEAFGYLLRHLRSGGEYSLNDIDDEGSRKMAELEMKFWGVRGVDPPRRDAHFEPIIAVPTVLSEPQIEKPFEQRQGWAKSLKSRGSDAGLHAVQQQLQSHQYQRQSSLDSISNTAKLVAPVPPASSRAFPFRKKQSTPLSKRDFSNDFHPKKHNFEPEKSLNDLNESTSRKSSKNSKKRRRSSKRAVWYLQQKANQRKEEHEYGASGQSWKGKPSSFFVMKRNRGPSIDLQNPHNYELTIDQWTFMYTHYPDHCSSPYELMDWLYSQAFANEQQQLQNSVRIGASQTSNHQTSQFPPDNSQEELQSFRRKRRERRSTGFEKGKEGSQ